MKILVTGRGSAGSWTIRGVQLGAAIGADIISNASIDVQKKYDVIICVKHTPSDLDTSKLIIWDMVDSWPQPEGNVPGKEKSIAYINRKLVTMEHDYCVAATARMRADIGASTVVYHHFRPGTSRRTITPEVAVVSYEGDTRYLGRWQEVLENECKERGWVFMPNADRPDILVAFRDEPFKGYATDNWKSNVKQANAQAAGIPFVALPEAGYKETSSGAELYIDSFCQLKEAFDILKHQGERLWRSQKMFDKSAEYDINVIAKGYSEWIASLL